MNDVTENEAEYLEPGSGRRVKSLSGRVAVVTGSDSGIGRAIAEAFALEGAGVSVTYHTDKEGARATAAQVEAAGSRAMVQSLDVRDEARPPRKRGSRLSTVGKNLGDVHRGLEARG